MKDGKMSKFRVVQWSRFHDKKQTKVINYSPRNLYSGSREEFYKELDQLFEFVGQSENLINYVSLQVSGESIGAQRFSELKFIKPLLFDIFRGQFLEGGKSILS